MKLTILAAVAFLFAATANASGTRTLDGQVITNGANTLTLPTSTDTLTGKATTDTLTNKSISGSTNTFTNIPANTALTSQVPVANGGTGASTLTTNNVIIGAGTSAVTFVAPGSSGNVLTSNGTTWSSSAVPASVPAVNGGSGSPQSITAGTGISLSSIGYSNFVWVVGNAGAVTVTATPSITACTADGQKLHVIGTSDTNTVTLQDNASLAGSKLRLNGNWVGAKYSVLELVCDFTAVEWDEVARR